MTEIAQPSPVLVSLTCGATLALYRILQQTGWNKTPKEKYAAGKIQEKIEPVIVSAPDPVTLAPTDPGFAAAQFAQNKAFAEWERTQASTLELGEYQFQTTQTCLKFLAGKDDTGTNRFFSELQEKFRVME